MEIAIVIFVIAVIFIARSVKVVPQQNAWVKERLGKYAAHYPDNAELQKLSHQAVSVELTVTGTTPFGKAIPQGRSVGVP